MKTSKEPPAALKVYSDMLMKEGIKVVYNERLNRTTGVEMQNGVIKSITMESGKVFVGKAFIDAVYMTCIFSHEVFGSENTVVYKLSEPYGSKQNTYFLIWDIEVAFSINFSL